MGLASPIAGPSRLPVISYQETQGDSSIHSEWKPLRSSTGYTPQPYSQETSSPPSKRTSPFTSILAQTSSLPAQSSSDISYSSQSQSRFKSRPQIGDPPPTDLIPVDNMQAALLHSARMVVSSQDQEAMRKLRLTMLDGADAPSESSAGARSIPSSAFPGSTGSSAGKTVKTSGTGVSRGIEDYQGRHPGMRSRRSTLSREVPIEAEDMSGSFAGGDGQRTGQNSEQSTVKPDIVSYPLPKDADLVVAVLGAPGVGKTTVIKRATKAWGLSSSIVFVTHDGFTVSSYRSQVQPGGKLKYASTVDFLEMDLGALRFSSSEEIWPKELPFVHGAILCYDATQRATLRDVPEALHRLSTEGISMVMLACKSDPDSVLEIQATEANALGEVYNVGLIEVTGVTPEGKSKIRNGLRWLLYRLEQRQRRNERNTFSNGSPPRIDSSTLITTRTEDHDTETPPSSMHRSDLTSLDSDASSGGDRLMWYRRTRMTSNTGQGVESDTRSSSSSLNRVMQGPSHPDDIANEVFVAESVVKKEGSYPTVVSGEILDTKTPSEAPSYVSLADLMKRLFTAIISTEDEPFVRAFLMTYRRFLHPRDVVSEFLERLQEIEAYDMAKDVRHWALMRLTGALIDWTLRYPGDFAEAQTQAKFREIVRLVLRHTFMAHLTSDLVVFERGLPNIIDVDASWSVRETLGISTVKPRPDTDLVIDSELLYDLDSTIDDSIISTKEQTASSRSISTSSLGVEGDSGLHSRRASMSVPTRFRDPNSDNGKFGMGMQDGGEFGKWSGAFDYFLNTEVKTFAVELTKMQWELFAAIRPRDIFRHNFGKEDLGPVAKAIAFFNHVSRWVSTLILANPKAKHRARIFERFIHLAHHLRRLNNYDTLYALISGMRETSVHRLAATHALVQVSPATEKDWQSHLKLMEPRGGYAYYRRAIQADMSARRPAIPLLTTILGLVSRLQTIRPQDIRSDGSVQWDKFARFGEILAIISECQNTGPMVPGRTSAQFRRIIEETPIINHEDGLYERSRMLEPTGGVGGVQTGRVMKRLANLGF